MNALTLSSCLLALVTASCVSAATAPPDELAADIVAALDAGQRAHADALFASAAGSEAHRERVYPVVFGAARQRFEAGEPAAASAQLDFLTDAYPEARSARVALLYSLFLQRTEQAEAEPTLVLALGEAVADVREASSTPPAWVDLVEAQQAIDGGELDRARRSYDRFVAGWNGTPAPLTIYVEDVGRYLATH